MRAAVIAAPETIEIRKVPIPEPGPCDLLVRLQGCGVCASNIPPWEGRPWFNYPMEPGALGHEGWGIVEAMGDQVTGFHTGDRVAMLSGHAYAEFDITSQDKVVRLPADLDDIAFPAEPLGCAMNIFHRSGILAGQTVAIIGIGFLGATLIALAKDAGAKVIAISRREWSLRLAHQLGADQTVLLNDPRHVIEEVAASTAGSGGYDVKGFCNCVIECAGSQGALALAGELCGVRAKLIVAGYHQEGLRQINMQLWNWRGLDVVNAHERDEAIYLRGMRGAIDAVGEGVIDLSRLFTHRFPLERLGNALAMAKDRPDGFLKGLIIF